MDKPPRHLLGTTPPPMRDDLLRLHVLETRLLKVFFQQLGGRPFRVRDEWSFVTRVDLLAGFGPGGCDAGVDGIDPGADGEDAVGGDDAVEFFDDGGVIGGEVDVCAGEGVGDGVGGDVLGCWGKVSAKALWIWESGCDGG